ncbi:MAG TPA: cupin domain-containing protein [Actinomycetota bacterium]|jgi:mannose-6-phosphate isomerase-like protein (cupin superfamily)
MATIDATHGEEEIASGREPIVLQPDEGRRIDLGNFEMSVKASGDLTAQVFTLLQATEPPGFGPPMHIHHNAAEAFYVLEGEYIMFIEDRQYRCPEGSFIYIPLGMRHGFRVGGVASRKLNLYAPGVMVGYFDQLSAAIADGVADEERLAGIAANNGVEVVGPVPEGYL